MNKSIGNKLKIKTILMLAIILFSLVHLIISAIGSSILLKRNNGKAFMERGNSLNKIVENTIVNKISQYEQLICSITKNGDFENEDYINNNLIYDMKLLEDSNDQIINVYFAKEDGRFIQSGSVEVPEDFDCREFDWFNECKNNPEKRVIERPYQDSFTKEMITTVYKTVMVNNEFYGVLAVDVKLSDLSNSLSMIKYGKNSELVVGKK